jgi:hypothetical protein
MDSKSFVKYLRKYRWKSPDLTQLEAVGSTYYRRASRPMNYAYLTYDMHGTPLTFCNMPQIQASEYKDKGLPVTCDAGTYSCMLTSALGGVGGQRQVPTALTPGPFWMNTVKRKSLVPNGVRTPHYAYPSRGESLYR